MFEDRTIYTIQDEAGNKTTITLSKLASDILQRLLPNVHEWVQNTYDKVVVQRPNLGRRQKGDLVRLLAERKAAQSLYYKEFFDQYLGMQTSA
jgi:hypothetical protein